MSDLDEFRAGCPTFLLNRSCTWIVELAPMIWKPFVKHRPVPVRSFVLALSLLICTTPFGWAAEPAGATIVHQLQLPPSTSPEAVKGLIADLAAKGALPVTQPARRLRPARAQDRKFADSPLERKGFELPVPRENGYRSESSGFVYLPETVRVSSKDLPTSGTEVSNPTNFRFPDQNQHIVRAPASSGG